MLKTFRPFALALIGLAATQVNSQQAPAPAAASSRTFVENLGKVAREHFEKDRFESLEVLVGDIQKYNARTIDGRFQLFMVTAELTTYIQQISDPSTDASMDAKFQKWRKQYPSSALEPIVQAIEMSQRGWRARGGGYASQVTEEGWAIFHERTEEAWKILMAAKKKSAQLPAWYSQAIYLANDMQRDPREIRALFDEGAKRHPEYHAIYFAYLLTVSPKWGGSFEEMDAFIREQADARPGQQGAVLYARLYWYADQIGNDRDDIFRVAPVNWPRMSQGFRWIMTQTPDSVWNQANYAMFACRAKDGITYAKLRPRVNPKEFANAAPYGISLEVCDRRFAKKP